MKQSILLSKIQSFLGTSQSELMVITLLSLGLIFGAFYQNDDIVINNTKRTDFAELSHVLDSVAEVGKTTYIGSDLDGKVYTDLAAKDTIVEKENTYPEKAKLPEVKININTASLAELILLPGVGEKTAQAIIEYRETQQFENPEDIQNVKGIGIKKYEKMKEYIIVK